MTRDDHRWPQPRLTAYALWLLASRVGAPLLTATVLLDLLAG